MKVILLQDIKNVGKKEQVIEAINNHNDVQLKKLIDSCR